MFASRRFSEALDKKEKKERRKTHTHTHRELVKSKMNTMSFHQFWDKFIEIKRGFRIILIIICVSLNFDIVFTLIIMN